MPERRAYIVAAAIAFITLVVFLPALRNGFVNWDDEEYVVGNIHIRSMDAALLGWAFSTFYASNWHPFTWVSHAVDYRLWGLEPSGHHLSSIILHALNTLLVTLLMVGFLRFCYRGESGARKILIASGITGLLFGLHPVHVESVAWVSERKDLLFSFFFLLSIIFYVRYAADSKSASLRGSSFLKTATDCRYGTSLILFCLSLLSKPMAVSLPLVLLILDWYPLRRWEGEAERVSLLIEKIPFIALSAASSVITIMAQKAGGALVPLPLLPLSTKIANSVMAFATYIVKLILPLSLAPFNPYPQKIQYFSPPFVLALFLVLGILFSCLVFLRKNRAWAAAWAYFLVTLIPVLGIVQVGEQSFAYRYLYIPCIGPFLLAGLATASLYNRFVAAHTHSLYRKSLFVALPLAVLISLSFMTIRQIHVWKDSVSLWSQQIRVMPSHAKGYHFRGNAYRALSHYDEAIHDFSSAIMLNPFSKPDFYNDRGIAYAKLGRYREALGDFSTAIMMNPAIAVYYRNRGNAYREMGDGERAMGDFQRAESISRNLGSRI